MKRLQIAGILCGVVLSTCSVAFAQASNGESSECLRGVKLKATAFVELVKRYTSPGESHGFNPQPDPPGRPTNPGETHGFNPQPDPPGRLRAALEQLRAEYEAAVKKCGASRSPEFERLLRALDAKVKALMEASSRQSADEILKGILSDGMRLLDLLDVGQLR